MNENPFNDYNETDNNYYEEENNSDLESRLYANIHYASIENEIPDETTRTSKILSTNTENIHDQTLLNNDAQYENSANKFADNSKHTRQTLCQSMQQDKEVTCNEVNKTVCRNSMEQICNINKDPYAFDINAEDQRTILPISANRKRKNKRVRQDEIKQKLLNFVFKVPNTLQTSQNVSNNSKNPSFNCSIPKVSAVSNITTSKKKSIESIQKKQDTENIFMKYQNSKQSLNKVYTEKHREIEEINTKYSVLPKKDKEKLQNIEHSNNAKEGDSDSDSDQSILEVPIPPKPQPPLINLNDSDEDTACTSNNDKITKQPLTIDNCNTTEFRNQVKKALSKSQSELTSANESEVSVNANVTEDIILNCTEIHKGASNVNEIRDMRRDDQKKGKSRIMEENSDVSQEFVKIINNKSKSGNQNVSANKQSLNNKDENNVDQVVTKKTNSSTCLTEHIGHNESETNLVNMNVDFTEDVFPADEFIRSQNKLNANKKRQLECQSRANDKVKRMKKSGELCQSKASTSNIHSRMQKNRDKPIDNSHFHPMSEKLKAFYNDSHGQENFDINEVRSKMSKDPQLWTILDEDLRPKSAKQRFWNVRCTRCQQHGHLRHNCPEPRRRPKCYMCGVEGHTEIHCPQKMCLTCGKIQGTFRKTCETCRTFYCTMCNAVGHKYTECPDLWRRYHQTTTTDNVSIPGNTLGVMKPADHLFCCNCTKRGHDFSMCKDYRWSKHFPTPSFVSNYMDGPTYTGEQFTNMHVQCPNNVNMKSHDSESGIILHTSDDLLPFPKELLKKKQSKMKAFPQQIQQLTWENERNIAYVIYQCGEFYTMEDNGMEISYTITARKGFNTYYIMECHVIPHFLEKLLELFKFEVKIYKEIGAANEIVLRIRTFANLISDLRRFILYWLSLEDDEKDYVIFLNLPLQRISMINILYSQIRKLGTEMGNPLKLHNVILSLKTGLETTKDKQKYDNMFSRLQETQLKLLMILNDHPNLRKICEEIRALVKILEESTSEIVPMQQYLQILTVYNFLFVPHTPPKSFIAKYGKKSNPAVTFSKSTQKSNPNSTIPKVQSQVQNKSVIPGVQYNRALSSNNSQSCKPVEISSAEKDFQSMSKVTKKKHLPPQKVTESPHHIRFGNNVNQSSVLENDGRSKCNYHPVTTIVQDEKFSNDFVSNRDIVQYDSASTSHDFLPVNTSGKYTNITVNVSNKNQVRTTDSLELNTNNSRNDERQNIKKCTNITLNVSDKNSTDTAGISKLNMDNFKNDKCEDTNKYTNIIVSVSNKNQAHTTTSSQSNVNNSKNNKHPNNSKYTNITVSVSDKNQTHTAVSAASNLNNPQGYDMQSSEVDNLKNNQSVNDDDDVVCIEIKKKVPSHVVEQKSNMQQNNNKNNANKKKLKKKNNKNNDFTSEQLIKALNKSYKLKKLNLSVKELLKICSSDNLSGCRKFARRIVSQARLCSAIHVKEAANAVKDDICRKTPSRVNICMLQKLVTTELNHQEEMIRLYKSFESIPKKKKN